jgi:hypothetical protein
MMRSMGKRLEARRSGCSLVPSKATLLAFCPVELELHMSEEYPDFIPRVLDASGDGYRLYCLQKDPSTRLSVRLPA